MSSFLVWPKRIGWALIGIGVIGVVSFIAVNVYGYLQFRRAWHIGDRLSQDDLRQIAAACPELEKSAENEPYKYKLLKADEIPPVFRRLNPSSAVFWPHASEFILYDVGLIVVRLNVSSSRSDRAISVSTDFFVPRGHILLWHQNPQFDSQCEPNGRLATITRWWTDGTESCDWIILPNEIRVVVHNGSDSSADAVIETTVPVTDSDRRKIVEAIAAIPAEFRGHRYKSDAILSGSCLHFNFSADGRHRSDDIELQNTWRAEVGPLVDAVSAALPKKVAINFIRFKNDVSEDHYYQMYQSSVTWAELYARNRRLMPLPWWCVWPRFLDSPS